MSDWENRPANYVSWYDAGRFANWMTTGDTENGVYEFSGGGDLLNHQVAGSTYGTAYFIPTEDEWYKAAYYDPEKPGGAGYWDYPTKRDEPYVPSNDLVEPTDPGNNATFRYNDYTIGLPYYRTEIGAHENSESPYDTFDQAGNVWEWNEALIDSCRGFRGGSYYDFGAVYTMLASYRDTLHSPSFEHAFVGFRVASVAEPSPIPEPSAFLIWSLLAALGVTVGSWRRRRQATTASAFFIRGPSAAMSAALLTPSPFSPTPREDGGGGEPPRARFTSPGPSVLGGKGYTKLDNRLAR